MAIKEHANVCANGTPTRRRELLAGSALAGGVLALMLTANPQTAYAQCTVTALPNTVSCDSSTTTNTTNTNAALTTSRNREQKFTNGGAITPGVTGNTVNVGATIDGFGLAITNTTAADITVVNKGTVRLTDGVPTVPNLSGSTTGGTSALNITGAGGTITYTGNGIISADGFATNAFTITNTGAGNILVGTPANPVTPHWIGNSGVGSGVLATNAVNGTTSIFLNGGTITDTTAIGDNIHSIATGKGDVNMTLTGNTALVNGSGGVNGVFGIRVETGGNVNIVSNANIGGAPAGGAGSPAVQVGMCLGCITPVGGNINVELTGGTITFANTVGGPGFGAGIDARASGNINITMDAGSSLLGVAGAPGAPSIGINAVAPGAITVSVNGLIDSPDIGMNITGGGGGILVPIGPNAVISANDIGFKVTNTGTGAINIISLAGSIICQGGATCPGGAAINTNVANPNGGIVTNAAAGTTSISIGGTVYAFGTNGGVGADGINATSTTGSISITTGAGVPAGTIVPGVNNLSVFSESGNAIFAQTTSGAITVTTGTGAVVGGTNGISATSTSGDVRVITNGQVAGNAADANAGILAGGGTTGAVFVSTGVGSNVTGGVGINVSASGAGAVSIETHGTVTGTGAGTGGVSGDAIHVVQTGSGNVTVQTFGTVTGNAANAGSDGIDISGGGTGATLVHTYAPVSGDPAIIVNMAGPVAIITDASSPTTATGPVVISGTSTASTVLVDVSANVTNTGAAGDGIFTSTTGAAGGLAANANTINVRQGVTVTGVGAGFAAINANTTTGAITVNIGPLATATNTTGIGVRLNTGTTGTATLNNQGTIVGFGPPATNPSIFFVNSNDGGAITINNSPTGLITNATNNPAGWAVTPGTAAAGGNTQPININNQGLFIGRIALAAGANTFTNLTGGTWNTASTSNFGANAGNTLANNLGAVINTSDTTVMNGIQNINNGGVVNAGAALADSTTFNANAGQVQTVTNSGANNTAIFNVIGCGSATCPGGTAGLIFNGAAGSSFSNSQGGNGGIVNLQADHTTTASPTTNAATMNTALFGTSDVNYSYTFGAAYHFNGDPNGSVQSPNSRLWVDTFLGGPGSTSDRLVFSGNASGTTRILVNDINGGSGAFNPLGITVVALGGASNGSNFVVDPLSKNYVKFGPLGAIDKGFFLETLLYVPGGATGNGGPTGNAYKFFGVPGPFAGNLPVAATGAQTIFQETADVWEDRQIEVRNCMNRGLIAAGQGWGSGANLALRARPIPILAPDCAGGIWTKLIGSTTRRNATGDLGQLNPLFTGLTFDNSYRQNTEGFLAGVDFARPELFSRFDSIVLTVMGGYISSFLDFNSPNTLFGPPTTTSFKYTGGTFGASLTYMNRGFFIDALLKGDFLNMDIGGIPGTFCAVTALECTQGVNVRTWGTVDNVGYRFALGRFFIEPLGSLIWTTTKIDDLNLAGAGVTAQFNNASRLDVGGGARFGGVVMDDTVHYVEASFTARGWDRVSSSSNNSVTFLNLGPSFTLTDNFKNAYAETAVQLDWINRHSGWSSYAKVDAKFNSELQTYTAKAGLRYQFGWAPAPVIVSK